MGNAISRGNAELEEVLDRKIRYCSLPEAVRDHFLWASRAIVITGTHGKTTTTSIAGWLLAHGGADPNVFIGGIAENFESSYRIGGGRDFVIEGDEYDSAFFDKTAKFLKYLPDIAVVNNIEFDHADIYPDLDAIRLAFRRLVNLVPRRGLLLLGADDANALALRSHAHCKVETFGLSEGADWQAHDLEVSAAATRFGVRRAGATVGTFDLPLLGAYNVRNALAAIAVGAATGLSTHTMAAGLREFKGVRRRLQHRGTGGAAGRGLRRTRASSDRDWRTLKASIAHFQTAICHLRAAIATSFRPCSIRFREGARPGHRVVCRRVPLDAAGGREPFDEMLIAYLKAWGFDARYTPEIAEVVRAVAREARSGDLVIVMSNGGFDDIHQKLISALEARAR